MNREQGLALQQNPIMYSELVLGDTLEDYQKTILQTIHDNDRIAISSCHNLGKTFTIARPVLHFGSCFPGSKIITTAPTFNQVKNLLWAEIRDAYGKATVPLGGKMLLTEWQLSADWFALGFTPKKEVTGGEGQGTASSFQGFHARDGYVIVIFDEATGVPNQFWTMAEGLLTSAKVKFIAIGNPTSRNCDFYKCFSNPSWATVRLSCFDSPNMIANGFTDMEKLLEEVDYLRTLPDVERRARLKSYKVVKQYLLAAQWVMDRALYWGVTHPLFISKAIGEFPEEGDNVAITLGTVEAAQARTYEIQPNDVRSIGVDVARFGTDSTIITYLAGRAWVAKKVLTKRDTSVVTGEIIAMCKERGWPSCIVVDATGIGAGVIDQLNEAKREKVIPYTVEIREVQFGSGFDAEKESEDKQRYVNLKAKIFDLLAKDLKEGLCLPEEAIYQEELPTVQYSYDSKGRMVIESKDDYKKRTGRGSPDHADSLAIANYGRHTGGHAGSLEKMRDQRKATPKPRSWSKKGKPAW